FVFPGARGASQSRVFAASWPNAASSTEILRPLADRGSGRLLVEDPSLAEYYLPARSRWERWSSTRNIVMQNAACSGGPAKTAGVVGAGNQGTFAMFIAEGYFSLVAPNFAGTTAVDHRLPAPLRHNHH